MCKKLRVEMTPWENMCQLLLHSKKNGLKYDNYRMDFRYHISLRKGGINKPLAQSLIQYGFGKLVGLAPEVPGSSLILTSVIKSTHIRIITYVILTGK